MLKSIFAFIALNVDNFATLFRADSAYSSGICSLANIQARIAGVDSLVANHPYYDNTPDNIPRLEQRKDQDPNPYVVGIDAYVRYLDTMRACAGQRLMEMRNGD